MSSQMAAKLVRSCGIRAGGAMNQKWRCALLVPRVPAALRVQPALPVLLARLVPPVLPVLAVRLARREKPVPPGHKASAVRRVPRIENFDDIAQRPEFRGFSAVTDGVLSDGPHTVTVEVFTTNGTSFFFENRLLKVTAFEGRFKRCS